MTKNALHVKRFIIKQWKLILTSGQLQCIEWINLLEDIGAISRRNIYKISCNLDCVKENACTIELDDNMVYHLSRTEWNSVIMKGLKACGYLDNQKVNRIVIESEKNT